MRSAQSGDGHGRLASRHGSLHAVLLVAAGFAAGVVNAIAGGGSLITFPTLIAIGLPPVDAERHELGVGLPRLRLQRRRAAAPTSPGRGGGCAHVVPTSRRRRGASAARCCWLTPARAFEVVVPFLVLGAAATLAFQHRLRGLVGTRARCRRAAGRSRCRRRLRRRRSTAATSARRSVSCTSPRSRWSWTSR